jgi:ferredoxin
VNIREISLLSANIGLLMTMTLYLPSALVICLVIAALNGVEAFISTRRPSYVNCKPQHNRTSLRMGFGDMLKKAFQNENLPPPQNPGLSKELEPVVIEFLPARKTVKALPGQKLSVVAQSSGIDIKYSCKKGDCGTCSVKVNGSMARACQTSIPRVANSKITIEVLPPQKGLRK